MNTNRATLQWRLCGAGFWVARLGGETIARVTATSAPGRPAAQRWEATTYKPLKPATKSGSIFLVRQWLAERLGAAV